MAGLKRIIVHWTAGAGRASREDLAHYHRVVEYDGVVVNGKEAPEDNIVVSDGDYAAHVLNLNTGSIGVAMCGMRGAVEVPFSAGPSPLNEKQFEAACRLIAQLAIEYGITITRTTVLTHAEVEPNLGVKQNKKWDITRLPWRDDLRGSLAVGDYMRERVRMYAGMNPPADDKPMSANRPTLRMGARGAFVVDLQTQLHALKYKVGKIDGVFGAGTRGQVLQFQADKGLTTDGIVGDKTWELLFRAGLANAENPVATARADMTMSELRERGSGEVAAADKGQAGVAITIATTWLNDLATGLTTDPAGTVEKAADRISRLTGVASVDRVLAWTVDNPLLVVALLFALYSYWQFEQAKAHRLTAARDAANMGR